ncbi:CrcB family protein [Cyanobium sp. Alchichica 3B3-8F6]|uniref:FluC/FEX family fluoride channel n=1 Tax=Cyanobium sp. Alchichica 3B3-8F6 TaxID=2823696 RepID=UPI0020CE3D88|nr:CrcB family protein [Cyanobium sp. Alchichica 3B3-8F6]MCP9881355.1 CrcB family protein [Cyanobium sp. Alchichica 3B3-8F6]
MSTTPARSLRGDLRDLALVAAGAIPGALLRWRLEAIGTAEVGGLRGLVGADFIANMLGCLLLGLVLAQSVRRKRLMLWAGIGFCGSLTTFSSWMLQLARALRAGEAWDSLLVLAASLLGGLVLVALGHALGRRCHAAAPASSSKGASPQRS